MKRLIEDSRTKLLNKSRKAKENPKDTATKKYGYDKNRFERRIKSSIMKSVNNYNRLDMNKFFRNDTLDVVVKVHGETDDYEVKIRFNGVLDELHNILQSGREFSFGAIATALIRAFNKEDVYVHCSCPDWKYRFAYWMTIDNINSGQAENRPSDITNPNNDLGIGCKHVLLVINNNSWLNKVASVIYNYTNYMEEHQKKLFADVIYPAIFEKPYEDEVQLSIFDKSDLTSDEDEINKSNEYARTKTQFKKGNQSGVQFAKKPVDDGKQLDIDNLE